METKKKTMITVETTNGREVHKGDVVVFSSGAELFIGAFDGLDGRGNWRFERLQPFDFGVTFSKAPRSIDSMYLVDDVNINNLPFMNPPIEREG